MKLRHNRYDDMMLEAFRAQTIWSLILNALTRGVLLVLLLQAISFAGGLPLSRLNSMVILAFIFALLLFTIDIAEKSYVHYRLRKIRSNAISARK